MAPKPLWAMAALVFTPVAAAQDFRFDIVVSNTVSPAHPSAIVEVWAAFDPDLYAFAGSLFDVTASPDLGGFSDPTLFLHGPGTAPGEVALDGDSVVGILPGSSQIDPGHFDTSNPILCWAATWSTDDFTERNVNLATIALKFNIYIDDSGTSQDFIESLTEGSGVVRVVPAPASAILLATPMIGRQRGRQRPLVSTRR